MNDETEDQTGDQTGHRATFPIVGIGASAGGLEAFTQLLNALPADTGMAFVLVQHLAPSHASALAEILSRATKMPVMEVSDEQCIEPNHVYVIPPGRCMGIANGALQLEPREKAGNQRVIDHFFRALAEESRHRAIGVVLSGTASDGTLGLEAIKAEGGITFAQDSSAQHDGMPSSAIASGCVDFVLAPAEIARELVRIAEHPHAVPDAAAPAEGEPDLAPILQLLDHSTGVDFSQYRFNTLYRRVTRRMALTKTEGLDAYLAVLKESQAEADALHQDLLIGVTSFFRNPEAFETLRATVFPRLLKERARHDPVRIWTLGCSTGQEAYSLAMAYTEFAESAGSPVPLQIFATDLSAQAVDKARAGVYPKDISQDVSAARLRRFFTEVDGGYRIAKPIRDLCVFSRHNVLSDPPFSRMDLISCRNLLIYLEPAMQQRVVHNLHYALKPQGCLWLGGSETVGSHRKLFDAADGRHKVYFKKPGSGPAPQASRGLLSGLNPRPTFAPVAAPPRGGMDVSREAERILLSRFAPPAVMVSAELDILKYCGDTQAYLSPATGTPSLSLLKMLREGLLVGVRAAVKRAQEEQGTVREQGLRVRTDSGYRDVTVEVIPVQTGAGQGFLILFEDPSRPAAQTPPPITHDTDITRLAQELSATRDYLQAIIEQHEAANEELQAASEEAQSANEELQSTNEELETSKEEIQSSNEELATVNDELNNRNLELTRLNTDQVNLIDGTQMAVVILGLDLRIRRFTPTAASVLKLETRDLGRLFCDLRLPFAELPALESLLLEVLDTQAPFEREVLDNSGHWYSLRLRPYRTLDQKIGGVVVMLLAVDLAHQAQERVQISEARYRLLFDSMDQGYAEVQMLFDTDGKACDFRYLNVNPAFEQHTGLGDVIGKRILELVPAVEAQWIETYARVALTGESVRFTREIRQLGRWFEVYASRIGLPENRQVGFMFTNVTQRKQSEQALHQNAADMSQADLRKNEFLATLAHELRSPLAPMRNALQILRLRSGNAELVQSNAEMMERQLTQMVHLVDDLLDVSRITQGKIELRREHIELASIVHQSVETIRPLCQIKGHALVVTLPSQPIWLDADPTRLAQVLGNLLNNACKYSDAGSRIALSAEKQGDSLVIRVQDFGIGISAEQLPLIFNMFAQVDTSLDRAAGGLGIGLALAKKMLELHSGSLEVHSDGIGRGSEFVMRLPMAEDQTAAAKLPITAAASSPPRRILVVDDNLDSAESMALLLNSDGHETQIAHDGERAVQAASTFRPEVIVLDIGLPKLNGYEVARHIREQPWGANIVLVALTGWGQKEHRQKSRDAGFDHHFVKPVDYAALRQVLAERN